MKRIRTALMAGVLGGGAWVGGPAVPDLELADVFELASIGDASAQNALAVWYLDDADSLRNEQEAVYWFYEAAEQGHPGAQANLAWMALSGTGMQADPALARHWAELAAQQNYPAGQTLLGWMDEQAWGGAARPEEAQRLYRAAAAHGDVLAAYRLGLRLESVRAEEAVRWFAQAAESGYPAAQFRLGMHYLRGEGVLPDWQAGYQWLFRASLASLRHAFDAHELAEETPGALEGRYLRQVSL